MTAIRRYGLKKPEDTEAFLKNEQRVLAEAPKSLPRSWRVMEELHDPRALRITRGNVCHLMASQYAMQDAEGFLLAAKAYIEYTPARAVSSAPAAWELSVDLAMALIARDRSFLQLIRDVVARSADAPGYIHPESYCTRAIVNIERGLTDAAETEIASLLQQCERKSIHRHLIAGYTAWCRAARGLLTDNAAAVLAGVEAIAEGRREFIDREIPGWKRGKPNVEVSPIDYFEPCWLSLLTVAEAVGIAVFDADNPAFAFCDYKWIQSLWA